MAVVTGEIFINRPPEAVFDYVADERNEPTYNPRMLSAELVTVGPIGTGSRFRATMGPAARPREMTVELTGFQRPERLDSVTSTAGMRIEGGVRFERQGRGTRMSWSWRLHPSGPLRVLGPVVAAVGARQERAVWAGLRRALESPPPTDAGLTGPEGSAAWVLVVYSSRYGGTQGIARRVAGRLRAAGLAVDLRPARSACSPDGYDAVVVGSAVYHGSWMHEAVRYVRRHHRGLAERPVWLFSSGPLGADPEDNLGRDKAEHSEPEQMYEYRHWLRPRGERLFFGSLRRSSLRRADRVLSRLAAARNAWDEVEGDFRDWDAVDAWADDIAAELTLRRPAA